MAQFDGDTYDEARDGRRLRTQLERVKDAVSNPLGAWWTLADLAGRVGGSEASVSARLRDLRKRKHGGYIVERRRVGGGWEYAVGLPIRGPGEPAPSPSEPPAAARKYAAQIAAARKAVADCTPDSLACAALQKELERILS